MNLHRQCVRMAALLVAVVALCGVSGGAAYAAEVDELLAEAHAKMNAGDLAGALKLADEAVRVGPSSARAWYTRAHLHERMKDYDAAVKDYTKVLSITPGAVRVRDQRGDALLKAGRMKEAIADYDAYLEARPEHDAHHWRRGIAYYYAGEYEKGVKQFERHKTVNGNDVENTVWHFLCNAKLKGVEAARADLLPPEEPDGRVPMMKVLELFAGKAKPADVLATAKEQGEARGQAESALFYAHLYIGLYHEATGDEADAKRHIVASATQHTSPHYMGDVARVHVKLRQWGAQEADPGQDAD